MTAKPKRPALGMGLDALLPDRLEGEFFLCPVEDIRPSPSQPRQEFEPAALEELAQSIREKGLIQPVVLRRAESGYELIAGERRWRAAQKAGLLELPAILRDATEEEVLELALIENLQREDLNPAEEALAYRALLDRGGLSQEDLAGRLGKSRSAVANALRLLALPAEVLELVRGGVLTPGHARAVLSVPADGQVEFGRELARRDLSVREAERLSKRWSAARPAARTKDPDVKALEERLARGLGLRVVVEPGRKKGTGTVRLTYVSLEELDRLLTLLPAGR